MNSKVVILGCLKLKLFIVLAFPSNKSKSGTLSSSIIFEISSSAEPDVSLTIRKSFASHDIESKILFPNDTEEYRNPGRTARPTVKTSEPYQTENGGNSTHQPLMAAEYSPSATYPVSSKFSSIPKINGNSSDSGSKTDLQFVTQTLNKKIESDTNNGFPLNNLGITAQESELINFALSKGGSMDCPRDHRQTLGGNCVEMSDF